VSVTEFGSFRCGHDVHHHDRLDQEDEREDRQRDEHGAVAAVLAQLFSGDGTDSPLAHADLPSASTASLTSSRYTSSREGYDSLIASTSGPAAPSPRVAAGAATAGSETVRTYPDWPFLLHPLTAGRPWNTRSGSGRGARVRIIRALANSRSRSSSGRPTVRRVVFRIATRSQRRSASSRRCVVRKIVTPRLRSPTISSWTSRAATGSRPEVGSSRNSTSGSLSSALANATRRRTPSGRRPQASGARSARLTARSARSIRSPTSAAS